MEVRQDVAMYAVMCPFFQILSPSFGSFYCYATSNGSPHNQDITRNAIFSVNLDYCHECVCGKVK